MPLLAAALLFDLDGVLADSTPSVIRAWSAWARLRSSSTRPVVSVATQKTPPTLPVSSRTGEQQKVT